ncbi:MAG: hypothetical protein ACOYJA_06650 [Christensenellales bacterium]|jgi:hypothetical protein
MQTERITVFTGNYGSGKTELALHTALTLAERQSHVTLVDMDIVNPYFRSSEKRALLEAHGVQVIAPTFAGTTVDIPALPAQMVSVFDNPTGTVVIDVGGDDTGATALGRFHAYFQREPYVMHYVINTLRPMSQDEWGIDRMMEGICRRSRLQIADLIHNTNLARETTAQMVVEGQRIVDQVSARTGLPCAFLAGTPEILAALPETLRARFAGRMIAFEPMMRPDWLDM